MSSEAVLGTEECQVFVLSQDNFHTVKCLYWLRLTFRLSNVCVSSGKLSDCQMFLLAQRNCQTGKCFC